MPAGSWPRTTLTTCLLVSLSVKLYQIPKFHVLGRSTIGHMSIRASYCGMYCFPKQLHTYDADYTLTLYSKKQLILHRLVFHERLVGL